MKYLSSEAFSVSGGTQAYRDNFDRIFRTARPKPRRRLASERPPEPPLEPKDASE